MRLRSGATGYGDGAIANAEVSVENTRGGYTIAGASGRRAEAWSEISGGKGDVIAGTFTVNGRQIALSVAIGSDPRRQPGPTRTTAIGRAAIIGRR